MASYEKPVITYHFSQKAPAGFSPELFCIKSHPHFCGCDSQKDYSSLFVFASALFGSAFRYGAVLFGSAFRCGAVLFGSVFKIFVCIELFLLLCKVLLVFFVVVDILRLVKGLLACNLKIVRQLLKRYIAD